MFPTCPSCKQSVLDDDPVTCPFCGASMSGKPGAAKPPAPAKPPATAKAAPVKAAAAARPASSVPASPTPFDDSPSFDLGDDFAPQAVVLTTKPSKSRTWEIKCPMCETVGYASPDASGKSVKCPNPKCMIPVFTAPRFQIEKPAAPKPVKPKSNIPLVAGVTVALMAVGGGLAWFIASQPNKAQLRGPSPEDLELIKQSTASSEKTETKPVEPVEAVQPKDAAEVKAAKIDKSTSPEAFAALLKLLNDTSLQKGQNRSKPYCRRMAAEAFALTGDLAGARKQLDALANVGNEVLFYKVVPLVEIAWQQLASNQRKAAAKTAEEALAAAAKLPKTGRERLETAISLAAVLVAANRPNDAQKVLAEHATSEDIAQLAAEHQAVQALETFDLAEWHAGRPGVPWSHPLTVGVIYELVGHRQASAAWKWAEKLPGARERAEAIAAWAEAVARQARLHSAEIPVEELRDAAQALPTPGDVLALSRLGVALLFADQQAKSEECLKLAADKAAAWTAPTDLQLPEDLKELSTFDTPALDERSFQFAASGELTQLAARLGKTEQADELLKSTLARARAMAPNRQSVDQKRGQVMAGGIATLRDRLKKEWKLPTNEKAQAAANTLQKNLDELEAAAERRSDLQLQLLTRAVEWGQAGPVWNAIRQDSSGDSDTWMHSNLPSVVAEAFQSAGNQEQFDQAAAVLKKQSPDKSVARPWRALFREAVEAQPKPNHEHVNTLLNKFKGDPVELDGYILEAVSRLAAAGKTAAALDFTAQLTDMVLKEECYVLIAGIAGRRGETSAVEKHLKELAQASEKVAIGRGLIAGLVARKAADAGN